MAPKEPIGNAVIVLQENPHLAELRDPHSGFIDYVPTGSIVKGAALMAGGEGETIPARSVTRSGYRGPRRGAEHRGPAGNYIFRQLNDMKIGNRKGPWVELMKQVR